MRAQEPAAPSGPAEWFACAEDKDCAAVPPGGCCFTGRLIAVNAAHTDAYAKATPCTKTRPICPMIRIAETRVPRCDAARKRCEMASP